MSLGVDQARGSGKPLSDGNRMYSHTTLEPPSLVVIAVVIGPDLDGVSSLGATLLEVDHKRGSRNPQPAEQ